MGQPARRWERCACLVIRPGVTPGFSASWVADCCDLSHPTQLADHLWCWICIHTDRSEPRLRLFDAVSRTHRSFWQSMRHKRPYNSAHLSHNRDTPEELGHEDHPTPEISSFRTGRPGARRSRLRRSGADFELPRPGAARVDGSAGGTRHHSSAPSPSSASSASSVPSARPHRGACASSPLRGTCSGSSRRGPACAACRADTPSAAACSRNPAGGRWRRRPRQQRCPQRRRRQRLTALGTQSTLAALCGPETPATTPGSRRAGCAEPRQGRSDSRRSSVEMTACKGRGDGP